MKNKKNLFYLLLVFALITISSCSKNYSEKTDDIDEISIRSNNADTLSDEQIMLIVNSKEYKDYFKYKDSIIVIINKALERGENINKIRELVLESLSDSTKELEVNRIIFGDIKKAKSFFNDFSKSRDSLFNRYPELALLSQSFEIDYEDQINFLFNNFLLISDQVVNKKAGFENIFNNTSHNSNYIEPPTCGSGWKQFKLSLCALGCSFSTGGIGTLLCGWGCWCWFCDENSELSKLIC